MSRAEDLERLYTLMARLHERLGGYRYLSTCEGGKWLPRRGVYFFFDPAEPRPADGKPRIVRVGTHAVARGSRTTLWDRLSQHRGTRRGRRPGGGNHRGSIFRLHVGTALLARGGYDPEAAVSWGHGLSAPAEVQDAEYPLERDVSTYIGELPFLWVEVGDEPSSRSERRVIESNTIGLLSDPAGVEAEPSSALWLGRLARSPVVRNSGLWNVDCVGVPYAPSALDVLERAVQSTDIR